MDSHPDVLGKLVTSHSNCEGGCLEDLRSLLEYVDLNVNMCSTMIWIFYVI
jgi:hypothetical protein